MAPVSATDPAARTDSPGGPDEDGALARRQWSAQNPGNQAIRQELLRHVRQVAADVLDGAAPILDIGCGGAWLLQDLATEVAQNRLAGIDLRADRIRAASRRLPGADLRVGDARELPYPDERFGLVLLTSTLSDMEAGDARAVLSEARRVLADGGLLLVYDVGARNPRTGGMRAIGADELQEALGDEVQARSLTLLPPLARRLGRLTPALYPVLSAVPVWRSHRLWQFRRDDFDAGWAANGAGGDEGWDPEVDGQETAAVLDAAEPRMHDAAEPQMIEASEPLMHEAAAVALVDEPEEPVRRAPVRRAHGPDTHVWMFVRNPCTNDRRVLREAQTLADGGFRVTILATLRTGLPTAERHGSVEIVRLPVRPLHYRFLRWYRRQPTAAVLRARMSRRRRLAWAPVKRRSRRRWRLEKARVRRWRARAKRRRRLIVAGIRRRRVLLRRRWRLLEIRRTRWYQARRGPSAERSAAADGAGARAVIVETLWRGADLAGAGLRLAGRGAARGTALAWSGLRLVGRALVLAGSLLRRGAAASARGAGLALRASASGAGTSLAGSSRARLAAWGALERAAAATAEHRPEAPARAAASARAGIAWLLAAPKRGAHARDRRRIALIVGDRPLIEAERADRGPRWLIEPPLRVLWLLSYLPLALVRLALVVAGLAVRLVRLVLLLAVTAVRLLLLPIATSRAIAAGIRPQLYEVLKNGLMRLHAPLLLHDYTTRATAHVQRRLDPLEAWNPCRHQIFHAHDLNTLVPARLLARRTGSPLVYDSHELHLQASSATNAGPLARAFLRRYERYLIRRADASITVCESLSTIIGATHRVAPPVVVRNTPDYEAIDVTSTRLRDELGLPAGAPVALYHGNVAAYRGLEELIEALPRVEDAVVVILGNGAQRSVLEQLVEDSGLTHRVFFHDAVPGDVLNEYVASADIGVIPLQVTVLNYYFSLPNKLFELMMAGRPVVAADLPEIRRVVDGYGVGFTFAPDSPAEMAEAMTRVLALSDAEREVMRARARAVARENCWEIERRKLLDLYRRVAVRRPVAA